ncbi:MAG TPA: hypothetical protein VF703_17005 [Pyrinomonadaceae bacterium]|jgi:hypothetical protein
MKSYRNAIAALALAFVFSTPASAEGVLWTDRTPPPPPPPTQASGVIYTDSTASQATGIMWTGIAAPAPEDDAVTEITLSLLQTLISLL